MTVEINFDEIDALVFDFDGVLTNNLVYLNQDGQEWVACSRSDGLAFEVLRKLKKLTFIISTENNPVVTARARKLLIPVLQGVSNKVDALEGIVLANELKLERVLYIGNDVNDFLVMKLCGYSACPSDSHEKIKSISSIVLNTKGGYGIVRELLEDNFGLDFVEILYNN